MDDDVDAVRLGDVLRRFLDEQILPRQKKFEAVIKAWEQLLPKELVEHSVIVDISGGQLKVQVDSACYLHELRLCKGELLKGLARRCPGARIRDIRFVIG